MPYLDGYHPPEHNFTKFARNFEQSITLTPTERNTLIVAGCYVVVIAILWRIPYLKVIIFPFKLLTVGFHEMSHAIAGVLTCARIQSIEIDADEGGATHMAGGISCITLPAGYLGSSFIGAALIACGFDTNASKVASIIVAGFLLITLYWAWRKPIAWILTLGFIVLFLLFWFLAQSVGLRFWVLFIGVMSDLYAGWDIIDDSIDRTVKGSDASAFADRYPCCGPRMWGVIWLIIAIIFFALGLIVGIVVFKESAAQQAEASKHFLPSPFSS